MQRTLVPLAIIVAMLLPVAASAKDTGIHIKVTGRQWNGRDNSVDIAILTKAASGLKPVTITSTSPQGEATLFLNSFANVSKKAKVQVYARVCKDGKYSLVLVEPGATLRADDNCDDKPVGFIPWGDGVRVTVNTTTGTLTVGEGGSLGTTAKVGIGAGGIGAVIAAIVISGGTATGSPTGTTTTPTATTPPATTPPATSPSGSQVVNMTVNITVMADPNGHDPFVNYRQVNQLTARIDRGSNSMQITGSGPWQPIGGTYVPTGGQINAAGTGFVAGRPNVQIRMNGTLIFSGQSGTINATLVIGEGPTLPNGPINYGVTGTVTSVQ